MHVPLTFRRCPRFVVLFALTIPLGLSSRGMAADPVTDSVAGTLERWEQASQTKVPPAVEDLETRHGITHSGHELSSAIGLFGPVRAERLQEDFHWKRNDGLDGKSVLVGRPRDEMDRLFYSSVEVTLDPSGAALELRFRDPAGSLRADTIRWTSPLRVVDRMPVLQPVRAADASETSPMPGPIQLATFVETETDTDTDTTSPPAVERPAADPAVAPPKATPDDVAKVLDAWTQAGKNIRSLQCRVRRYQYDSIFQVETRGQGRLLYEAPHQGVLELQPTPIAAGQRSTRTRSDGRPYELVGDAPVTLHWARAQLTKISPDRFEYERFTIPEAFLEDKTVRTVSSFDVIWTTLGSPRRALPGLVEVDAESLANRFDWTIINRDDKQILLSGKTVEAEERRHFTALQVVVDARTYLTKATKVFDPTGTRETVHVFEDMRVNEPVRLDASSWVPNLKDFYELSGPRPAPPPSPE